MKSSTDLEAVSSRVENLKISTHKAMKLAIYVSAEAEQDQVNLARMTAYTYQNIHDDSSWSL